MRSPAAAHARHRPAGARRRSAGSSPSSSPTSSASRPLSEGRDAEDMRELLSRYFDTAAASIERYGGTVEKFIGDAVMAVWGAPVARRTTPSAPFAPRSSSSPRSRRGRSDARACRRAPACSPARRRSRSAPRARAWSPATSSTPRRGSSRRPSPGTVLVGEATSARPRPPIAYEDAGEHELKGKSRARHALAGAAGRSPAAAARSSRPASSRRSSAASASSGSSRSSSTPPPTRSARTSSRSSASPGSGKSRLGVGVREVHRRARRADVCWHRGRCLAYGEGVAYWALAEMVRMRARHRRGRGRRARRCRSSPPSVASSSPTRRSARWSSRGCCTCSDSRSGSAREQEDLFAAWRLFFERMAEQRPSCSSSRTSSGRTRRCSTSSSTCSSWSRDAADLRPRARPARAARAAPRVRARLAQTSRRSRSSRSPTQAIDELLDGLVPGFPTSCASGSSSAPRACRCTRSRPSACCSTAACSSRRDGVYRVDRRDRRRSRCPRPCRR